MDEVYNDDDVDDYDCNRDDINHIETRLFSECDNCDADGSRNSNCST